MWIAEASLKRAFLLGYLNFSSSHQNMAESISPRERQARKQARRIGLVYSNSQEPGYSRLKSGKRCTYQTPGGKAIRSRRVIARLDSLVIPPAWREVWICRSPRGHLQATGLDEKNRKQYLYHPKWSDASNGKKFSNLLDFGKCLPMLRSRVEHDLRRRSLFKDKISALVVALIDETLVRVGNEEYARENRSYGLTTLRKNHVSIGKHQVTFKFRGKSGIHHEVSVDRVLLVRSLKECVRTPGSKLFRFLDLVGHFHTIRSNQVNDYLRNSVGRFTAKDFRTWKASAIVAEFLSKHLVEGSESETKRICLKALDIAAESLGNTRSVCKKHYVHPFLIEAFTDSDKRVLWRRSRRGPKSVSRGESLLMRILKHAND